MRDQSAAVNHGAALADIPFRIQRRKQPDFSALKKPILTREAFLTVEAHGTGTNLGATLTVTHITLTVSLPGRMESTQRLTLTYGLRYDFETILLALGSPAT